MKMDIGSSQSWWWESHNRPKHSKWLQENLADIETHVQEMLTLIEGDADSFAQRAEMYYKKRPDLLKAVEQFYRGYRSLAERYDQLSGSIRQLPSAIQSQYGITSESPRASPFGRQIKFNKQGSGLDKHKDGAISYADSNDLCEGDRERDEVSSVDVKCVGESQDGEEVSSSSSSSCSDGESDQSSVEIQRLQQTVERLQAENRNLTNKSREKQQQYRETEKRLHGFREDFLRVQKENNTLKAGLTSSEKLASKLTDEVQALHVKKDSLERSLHELEAKVSSFQEENEKLSMQLAEARGLHSLFHEQNRSLENEVLEGETKRKELMAALRFMKGSVSCLLKKNKALAERVSSLVEEGKLQERILEERRLEFTKLMDEMDKLKLTLDSSKGTVTDLNVKVEELSREVSALLEENERQKMSISDCAEEKREAIRQLCFSMDLLNKRNQWLEELLWSAKSRLNEYQKLVASQGNGWRGLFG